MLGKRVDGINQATMAAPAETCPVSIEGDLIRVDFPAAFTDESFRLFCDAFVFLLMDKTDQSAEYMRLFSAPGASELRNSVLRMMYGQTVQEPRVRCLVLDMTKFVGGGDASRVAYLAGKLLPYKDNFVRTIQGTGLMTVNEGIKAHTRTITSKLGIDEDGLLISPDAAECESFARAFLAKFLETEKARVASSRRLRSAF